MQALVSESGIETAQNIRFKLSSLAVTSQIGEVPVAHIKLIIDGQEAHANAQGSGPVDTVFKAIEQLAASNTSLELYSVNVITIGTDSQSEVTVRLEKTGRIVNGLGADTDIIIASVKAYIHALNTLGRSFEKADPQV